MTDNVEGQRNFEIGEMDVHNGDLSEQHERHWQFISSYSFDNFLKSSLGLDDNPLAPLALGPKDHVPPGKESTILASEVHRIRRKPVPTSIVVACEAISESQDGSFQEASLLKPSPSEGTFWNPVWLTFMSLMGFLIFFLVLLFVVLGLESYSRAHDGLAYKERIRESALCLDISPNYDLRSSYIALAQSRFLLQRAYILSKMRQVPTPAKQSFLLDYIDPILPTSFVRAIKNRHWSVITSISVYLMIKLCIVLSSGVLILVPTQVSQPVDSMVLDSIFSVASLDMSEIAADPVEMYYGAAALGLPWVYGTQQNLTVQTFSRDGLVATTSEDVLKSEVLGFSVAMEYELAEVANIRLDPEGRPWVGIGGQFLFANISGSGCQLEDVVLGQSPDNFAFHIPNKTSNYQGKHYSFFTTLCVIWEPRALRYVFEAKAAFLLQRRIFNYYVCNSGFNYAHRGAPGITLPSANSSADYRFLLTMSEVTWNWHWPNGTKESGTNTYLEEYTTNWTIAQVTAVMCQPSYSIDTYQVSLVPSSQTVKSANIISNTSTSLADFQFEDLLDGIMDALNVSTLGQGGDDFVITAVPPMFMLLAGLNNDSTQAPLINPTVLKTLSKQALEGIGTQFAEKYLKEEIQQPFSGFVIATQQRLQVKKLTAWLLITILGLLSLLALVIYRYRPWNSTPCPTESMASAAIILKSSEALRRHLQAQTSGPPGPVTELEGSEYQTVVDLNGQFSIQPVSLSPALQTSQLSAKFKGPGNTIIDWWRPLGARRWFVACLTLTSVLFIAALEIIQHLSDRYQGIAGLSSSDNYHLAISYMPTFLMLLVATMFETLNSAVFVFAPFLDLRRGGAIAQRSLSTNYVSDFSLRTLYVSVRNRHWAVFLSASAVLLSSLLTIVASGLFSPWTLGSSKRVQIQQLDYLNLSHIDLSQGDNLAGTATKLMVLHNLSYPTWTFDDLVFPAFMELASESSPENAATLGNSTISMTIPALRPSLECIAAPSSEINLTGNYYSGPVNSGFHNGVGSGKVKDALGVFIYVNATFPWSLAETNTTLAQELGVASWDNFFIIPNDTQTTVSNVPFGFASPIQWYTNSDFEGSSALEATATNSQGSLDITPYTPAFGIMAGWASGVITNQTEQVDPEGVASVPGLSDPTGLQNTSTVQVWNLKLDMTAALCYQVLEEVQTEVTLNWPNMTVSLDSPPVPDETTARVILSNETSTATWLMSDNKSQIASPHWFGISVNNFLWVFKTISPSHKP